MKLFSGCAAAVVAASLCACTGASAPATLVGAWEGTITCYSIVSPLTMKVEAATPSQATLAQGDGGALEWTAAATLDNAGVVTLDSGQAMADAAVLNGKLAGDVISGEMKQQLCSSFELKRAK